MRNVLNTALGCCLARLFYVIFWWFLCACRLLILGVIVLLSITCVVGFGYVDAFGFWVY